MSNRKLVILLAFICSNMYVITAQSKEDSASISMPQIRNIYIGLKQSESYRNYYYECLQGSNELNQIINDQDQELKKRLKSITFLNSDNEVLNKKITSSEVEIQRLKNKKIPIWKHPVLYGILGFIGGIYLMK